MQNYITDTFKTASENTSHTQTATESVINYIRNLILNRELRIGDKLPTENELCEQLGVGRGSVREAVKRLEAISLLNVRRGDGTYISDVRQNKAFDSLLYKIVLEDIDFQEIVDYRIQLEIGIMQLAIRNVTEDILKELKNNLFQFSQYITNEEQKSPVVLHDLDIQFHNILGKASKNRLLADVYAVSLSLFSPYMLSNYGKGQVQSSPEVTIENHTLLLNALENKDISLAIYAVVNSTQLWQKWNDYTNSPFQ